MSCNLHSARSMGFLQMPGAVRLSDVAAAVFFALFVFVQCFLFLPAPTFSDGVVVKTENVLVRIDKATGRFDGRVKLTDFGISMKTLDTTVAAVRSFGGMLATNVGRKRCDLTYIRHCLH
jgi:hypothetical protein